MPDRDGMDLFTLFVCMIIGAILWVLIIGGIIFWFCIVPAIGGKVGVGL